MTPTPAQLAILKERFPHIGENVLRINADALLSRPHLAVISKEVMRHERPQSANVGQNRGNGRRQAPSHEMPPLPSDPAAGAASRRHKPKRKSRVPLTRNGNTWSEAMFWQRIRSCLRRLSRWWQPARMALHAARVPCRGPRGQKWAYLCCDCGPTRLHPRKNVQVDHVVAVGTLTDYAHVGDFVRRLLPEDPAAFAVRCLEHHQAKTNAEREAKRALSA